MTTSTLDALTHNLRAHDSTDSPPSDWLRLGNPDRRDAIAQTVEAAVAAVEPFRRALERRREARYPYPYPIPLTPYLLDGTPDADGTFVVIGKHLAPHGLDFYCKKPLADRRVIASLDCGQEGWIGLVVELAWCRFNRHGWYDNGGRFVAIVEPPLAVIERSQRPPAA